MNVALRERDYDVVLFENFVDLKAQLAPYAAQVVVASRARS